MDDKQFIHWISQIYETSETEIDCTRLQELLPAYVESEITSEKSDTKHSQINAHLLQCTDCAEDYEALYQVTKLEAEGPLPQIEESLARFEKLSQSDQPHAPEVLPPDHVPTRKL